MRTIQQLAQEALQVQDASNLSGVVHSFSAVIAELRVRLEEEGAFSTHKLNTHPITIAFALKLVSLATNDDIGGSFKAFEACERLAKR